MEVRDLGIGKVLERFAELRGAKLRVGVVGPRASERTADGRLTNAENAVIQQYGLAPKHYTSRDFLNAPFKEERARVANALRRAAGRVVRLEATPEQALDAAGYDLEKIATDAILDKQVPPPNRTATVDSKGFDHPLVDSLGLVNAISHRVVKESGALEAGSAIGDYESYEIGGG
jgi:hypothetical protein